MRTRIATTLYTYPEDGYVRHVAVAHYGTEPLFLRGYAGPAFSLGDDLRGLVERGGRDMDAAAAMGDRQRDSD